MRLQGSSEHDWRSSFPCFFRYFYYSSRFFSGFWHGWSTFLQWKSLILHPWWELLQSKSKPTTVSFSKSSRHLAVFLLSRSIGIVAHMRNPFEGTTGKSIWASKVPKCWNVGKHHQASYLIILEKSVDIVGYPCCDFLQASHRHTHLVKTKDGQQWVGQLSRCKGLWMIQV